MTRLYIPEPLAGIPLASWFAPLPENLTYQKELPPNFFTTEVERTEVKRAEAIVLSTNFKDVLTPEAQAYVKKYADLGESEGKPVYAFSMGDFTDGVRFDPRVYVFRLSLYRDSAAPRDISLPVWTEDNAKSGITLRSKQERPRVSFCGMGDLPTLRSWTRYFLKNSYFELKALFNKNLRARKLGVYWRRALMSACSASPLLDTHFIVRKTFSGSRKTIELDPAQARREYLESITGADFVLAPKGDGNYSNRFLKTLCMGRIPVLVDTNVVLPLEGSIDYSKIVVRIPMEHVQDAPRYIREFYDAVTEEEWHRRQYLARETFEKHLRQDVFFKNFFSKRAS